MSREIGALVEADLVADVVAPFFALSLHFDTGVLRFWTGVRTATLDGNDYVGTGNFMTLSEVEETMEMSVRGLTVTLAGIPPEVISLALTEPYQGRPATLSFGLIDRSTNTPSNLVEIFAGSINEMDIEEGFESATVALTVENKYIDLERPRVARFTSAHQKSKYPGDRVLDFIPSLQEQEIRWGRA